MDKRPNLSRLIILLAILSSNTATAASVTGKVHVLEGHVNPACRMLFVKPDHEEGLKIFRLPDTGADNSILAVAMMALSQDRPVTVVYTDGSTTGCGTEPRVEYLRITQNH